MNYSLSKRRVLTVIMILALAMVFWFACTVKVNAAAKKTFNVVTEEKTTYKMNDGSTYSYTSTYQYFKTGLLKSITENDGYKVVYTRDKSGVAKGIKYYGDEGKLTGETVNTIKKGKITASKYYSYFEGKKLVSKTKYIYTKGKLSKTVVTNAETGDTTTTTYYSNGVRKSTTSKTTKIKYDKQGFTTSYKYTSGEYSEVSTYKNTYDKKTGRVKKIVETTKTTNGDSSMTHNSTETYKYTVKGGNVKKCEVTYKFKNSDGNEGTSSYTTTYNYKKVKVAKKYWKYM